MLIETSQAITLSDIENVAKKLDLVFPDDFKEHYLLYNGGYPEKDTYSWSNGEKTTINTFFSIKYDGFDILEKVYESLILSKNYLSKGIVPFATDDGGNFFCISCTRKSLGEVFYCDNNHYNVNNKDECLIQIENSFTDFLNNISA